MDDDGYPTDASLKRIRTWRFEKGFEPLMEFVRSIWWMPDWGWRESNRRPAEVPKMLHHKGNAILPHQHGRVVWQRGYHYCT